MRRVQTTTKHESTGPFDCKTASACNVIWQSHCCLLVRSSVVAPFFRNPRLQIVAVQDEVGNNFSVPALWQMHGREVATTQLMAFTGSRVVNTSSLRMSVSDEAASVQRAGRTDDPVDTPAARSRHQGHSTRRSHKRARAQSTISCRH
jgi:hypothetical protein